MEYYGRARHAFHETARPVVCSGTYVSRMIIGRCLWLSLRRRNLDEDDIGILADLIEDDLPSIR